MSSVKNGETKGDRNWYGFVVSDWGSIPEMINHGVAKDKKQAAEIAIKTGSDMDMEGGSSAFSFVPASIGVADTTPSTQTNIQLSGANTFYRLWRYTKRV